MCEIFVCVKESMAKLHLNDNVLVFIRHDRSKAVDILVKDLKVFATFNEELFKEITQLLTLENFR